MGKNNTFQAAGNPGCVRTMLLLSCIIAGIGGIIPAEAATVTWDMVSRFQMKSAAAKPAVDAAISEAKTYLNNNPNDELILYFPAGDWNFHHPNSQAIYINNVSKGTLILRGDSRETTRLIFDQFDKNGINLSSSHHVTIERLHLTRPVHYSSQGEMISFNGTTLRLKLHEGFMDPVWYANQSSSRSHERVLLPFYGDPLAPITSAKSPKINIENVVDAGNGMYDFAIASYHRKLAERLAAGDRLAFKAKVGHATVSGRDCSYLTCQDILITNSSRDGIWLNGGNYCTFRRVKVSRGEPINGNLPYFSQPADGLHIDGGKAALFQDCEINGTADDAIAIFGRGGVFTGITAEGNVIDIGLARSIVFKRAADLIIRDNIIKYPSMLSMELADLNNVVIENNTIIDNATGTAINIQANRSSACENIQIRNNKFFEINQNSNLIALSGLQNSVFENNIAVSFADNANNSYQSLLSIRDSRNIEGVNYFAQETSMTPLEESGSSEISVSWEYHPTSIKQMPSLITAGKMMLRKTGIGRQMRIIYDIPVSRAAPGRSTPTLGIYRMDGRKVAGYALATRAGELSIGQFVPHPLDSGPFLFHLSDGNRAMGKVYKIHD